MANHGYPKDRTALLFIDPYNDFLSEGGKLWPMVEGVAKRAGCGSWSASDAARRRQWMAAQRLWDVSEKLTGVQWLEERSRATPLMR